MITLSSQEIVNTYSLRWDIEIFFKVSKPLLHLAQETQTWNYQALICHTTIVFTRYILLSWQQRCANDERTLGSLFYELVDQMKKLDGSVALLELVKIIQAISEKAENTLQDFIESQLQHWIDTLLYQGLSTEFGVRNLSYRSYKIHNYSVDVNYFSVKKGQKLYNVVK